MAFPDYDHRYYGDRITGEITSHSGAPNDLLVAVPALHPADSTGFLVHIPAIQSPASHKLISTDTKVSTKTVLPPYIDCDPRVWQHKELHPLV